MTLYRLHHNTTYDYAEPVVIGTHFMHLLPRDRPGQSVREAQLDILPAPDCRRDEVDHFGNPTTMVSLAGAHKQFSVSLSATAEVNLPAPPPPPETPRWEAVATWGQQDLEVAEFCLPSR
ncbi:MAG: transglutaminase family protein, partial [Rhodospirillales bacterium]|nr:transglutaminase family protein [Rhodospirillales bacterium]